jgi:predicted lipid-binding transport protein (Tim44 family)
MAHIDIMTSMKIRITSALGVALAFSLLAAEAAEARRGGSFGSRGMRTYQSVRPTQTSPTQTAPVQRSMTAPQPGARPAAAPAQAQAQANRPRGGFLGGMGGGLLGGLLAGGLIGMMLGHGFGGMGAGLLTALLQVGLVALAVMLVLKLFRRRSAQPQAAGGFSREAFAGAAPPLGGAPQEPYRYQAPGAAGAAAGPWETEISVTPTDREAFERLLTEVQDAFTREDYAALRSHTTPEVMSYLAEELSENATQGRRNEVTEVRLLEADVAEAWREGDAEYATAALRYESRDVMRDRQSGAVTTGDASQPTETTELWTFIRRDGEPWKVSAIQAA